MDNNNTFTWLASGNAPLLYPTEIVTGDFLAEDLTKTRIPPVLPFANKWGTPVSLHLSNETRPAPKFIIIGWFSIVDHKFYAVVDELPKDKIEALLGSRNEQTKKPAYNTLIAGMAPYGKLALWLSGQGMTTEVGWLQGKEITMSMKEFAPRSQLSREEYAEKALTSCKEAADNLRDNGLPDPALFDRYMQKFNYCITPKFEKDDEFEGVELYYFNGELNTTLSDEYAAHDMRAKPYKIVLNWRNGKKQYGGYFWIDEPKLIETFQQCFGAEPEQEGNLTIQVGASANQFQFSLQTKEATVEIPSEDMQYIIFKNKFEFLRSPNYKKPPQGWRN